MAQKVARPKEWGRPCVIRPSYKQRRLGEGSVGESRLYCTMRPRPVREGARDGNRIGKGDEGSEDCDVLSLFRREPMDLS